MTVLLKTEEAAKWLDVSPRTLETWRVRGGGPRFIKNGRRVAYRETDLDAWIEEQTRRSTSDRGAS